MELEIQQKWKHDQQTEDKENVLMTATQQVILKKVSGNTHVN